MLVINIYYTGKDGSARKFAEEMTESGTVELVRKEEGNFGYTYFFPKDDPEDVLLVDKWKNRAALDRHHKSPMMETISKLRQKYHLSMRVEQYFETDGKSVGDFEEVIRTRTAVRKFSDKPVSDEMIKRILEAGRYAPTAKNMQPQEIYVLKSKEALKKIDKATPCRYNAPICLLVCADKDKTWKNGDYSTYEMDACIVATHMMLEATNLGVDNIWIKHFDEDIVRKVFNLPASVYPVCLLPLGYRADDYAGNPLHAVRKDLSEYVHIV